jgi:hypothetical protein
MYEKITLFKGIFMNRVSNVVFCSMFQSKDNLTSATNIAAVLLSCVKSLPLDESTHDIPIGLGPTWMNKASSILLSILPSPSNEIRRAASQGLAFLATLGVKSDMRFLQSAVLHSLDEVVSRNQSQGQGRNVVQDESQNGRSGGLLALGCIQRNTHRIKERRVSRSRLRGSPVRTKDRSEDSLQVPTIQIMIRVLPYVTGHLSSGISLNSRASALHAFLMLLEYSGKLESDHLSAEDLHLLRKAVEIVEDNFLSSWTVASHVLDQGNEIEKISFESSFLSVLLRFMTFLIPSLHHLEEFDSGIARRFSTMAVIITECHGDHPVVQLEALAFFELLAGNQDLLPAHGGGLNYDEHPILSCIPSLMANITPDRLLVLSRGIQDIPQGCHSSDICLRATLRVLRVLSVSQILVAEWSDMKVVSLLFAALEAASARESYSGETFHRGLASPREAEISFNDGKHCVEEVSDVLRYLLYLERALSKNSEPILLRYLLLSRSIIAGSNIDDDGEYNDDSYTVARVAKAAIDRAASDSQSLFELASPIRWQVKAIAVQMTTIALMELATKYRQNHANLVDSQNFSPKLAKIECSKACNDSNTMNSDIPKSILALHIPELVTGGCVVATATVDQVELRTLQENSMHCLVKIIDYFGAIPDPDEPEKSVLSEYVPQLSSCIKSSLSAPDEKTDELICRLFWAGCNCLRSFIRSKVTEDIMVLKRLIRPVIVTEEDVPFFNVGSKPGPVQGSRDESGNLISRSALMVKIGKIWMLGNIPLENNEINRLVQPDNSSIGVHAAALAIDGAKLLLRSKLSLCGQSLDSPAKNESNGFFSFRDICDIDDYTKAALAKSWGHNAQLSIKFLSDALASNEISDTKRKECLEWLELIIPFLFSGLYDAIKSFSDELSASQDTIYWANEVDVYEIACCCLTGIIILTESPNLSQLNAKWKKDIEAATVQIYKCILLPVLVVKSSRVESIGKYRTEGMVDLIVKSCELFKAFSSMILFEEDSDSCPFLLTLLSPLDLLEKKEITLTDELASTIISACLISVARIIGMPASPSTLAKSMLSLVISLSTRPENIPEIIDSASQELIEECLHHESSTTAELTMVTLELAKSRNWTAWSSVVKIKDGIAAEKSLLEVENALLNPSDVEEQLNALGAIRSLIQSVPPPNPLVGRILSAIGAEVFSVFQAYGTLSNPSVEIQSRRATVCADCMKIALASYQQFSSDFSEEEITEFLIVLFEVFIAVLRFNGLPNHPPPQGKLSDPSIGRMCAQAITHVARTTPIPFKGGMGGMAQHDRAVLEFAVRGEMNGYAVATAPAPTKKKLSLKGFK